MHCIGSRFSRVLVPGIEEDLAVRDELFDGASEARVSRSVQGDHVIMTDGRGIVTIPSHNPTTALTKDRIVRDADGQSKSSRVCRTNRIPTPVTSLRIAADTGLRLSRYFRNSAEFRPGMQEENDLHDQEDGLSDGLARIPRARQDAES